MKKIILHVGLGKTGTTSLQRYLARNAKQLSDHGILYPETGRVDDGHHNLFPLGISVTHEILEKLSREVAESGKSSVLMSSENAYYSVDSISHLREALGLDLNIVLYIRPQIEAIFSTYLQRQRINLPYSGTLREFYRLHRRSFCFEERLRSICAAANDPHPEVRLYINGYAKDDVVSDFLNFLGLSKLKESNVTERDNTSLHPCFSRLISLMDQDKSFSSSRTELINLMIEESSLLAKQKSASAIMDESLMTEIRNFYQDSNLRLSESYLSEDIRGAFVDAFAK